METLTEVGVAIKLVHRAGGRPIEDEGVQDIRELLRKRGHQIDRPRRRPDEHIGDFESVGTILKRMRALHETRLTPTFNRDLSLTLDAILEQEDSLLRGN